MSFLVTEGYSASTRALSLSMIRVFFEACHRHGWLPGLEDLQGRGVFYGAAVSEAPAMRGRHVFVTGGGNSAGQTALHLAKWAKEVTILVRAGSLADSMSDYLIRQIAATPNIDVRYRVQVADGTGMCQLQSLVLQDTASGTRHSVPADALFVLIGSQPRTQWLGQAVARDRGTSADPAGGRAKTVLTEIGPVKIEVPRDRDGASSRRLESGSASAGLMDMFGPAGTGRPDARLARARGAKGLVTG